MKTTNYKKLLLLKKHNKNELGTLNFFLIYTVNSNTWVEMNMNPFELFGLKYRKFNNEQ